MSLSAKTSYKKQPGQLYLSGNDLVWQHATNSKVIVRISLSDLKALFLSKRDAAQVKLKIEVNSQDAAYLFTFLSPADQAWKECEEFKTKLTPKIAENRATSVPSATNPSTPLAALPAPSSVPGATSRLSVFSSPQPSRAVSISRDHTPGPDVLNDFRIRKKVLTKDPELAALHRELVMSGQITESEFWEGREHLLAAQAATDAQQKGRPGQLLDLRPEMKDGKYNLTLTPAKMQQLFNDYPVVKKAYDENVPHNVKEEDFWIRFLKSKLHSALQASIRSTVAQHVTEEDGVFDRYLEQPDDGLEPRNQVDASVEMFVNLTTTQEDHDETGNEKDITMQAGKNRGALPLIRRFNQHSERVLKTAFLEGNSAKRRRIDPTDPTDPWNYYSQIDLEDLHASNLTADIPLEMKDSQRYFEGGTAGGAAEQGARPVCLDLRLALQAAKEDLRGWDFELPRVKIEKRSGEAALQAMTQSVIAQNGTDRDDGIPETVLRSMRSCHAAANEFLRQFWTAIYPPPVEAQTLGPPPTPAQKQAKAARMISLLARTSEKVAIVVREAGAAGADRRRVELAMQPVLDAAEHALAFWKVRSSKAGK
ncbi:hypothetical protein K488DRAFT_51454 [Vararia minispora EC-137]|uniref:Uncharacterized protein n=1 Tax=Vararia minispora EC-137 TaxID=1314806 RepID=A0ACB8QIW7_9AGAM|nr:hypothetical protein K488DRAFT_51454 [Vararia minispora EC-137]